MNGKKARKLRGLAKRLELPTKTTYIEQGRQGSWADLPLIKGSLQVDKKMLHKLMLKTDNPKFKKFGQKTYMRYAKGISRLMDTCVRSVYKDIRKSKIL